MKKHVLALCLCLFMIFQMTGCSAQNDPQEMSAGQIASESAKDETAEDRAAESTGAIKEEEEAPQESQAAPYIKFIEAETSFSDGLCWAVVEHMPEGEQAVAIVDTEGNIRGEIPADRYETYGDFYNGIALVITHDDVWQYVNDKGEVIFSSDNSEYAEQIYGMYDDGYVYLVKTVSSFESSEQHEALMRCTPNGLEFVYTWGKSASLWFAYLGEGVFLDADSRLGSDILQTAAYNFSRGEAIGRRINGDDGLSMDSLTSLPKNILSISDGWCVVEDEPRVTNTLIAIEGETTESYKIGRFESAKYGLCSDGCIVILSEDSLGYFDTHSKTYCSLDYKYFSQIKEPENMRIYSTGMVKPALNFKYPVNENNYGHTDYAELMYSEGAMMLGLNGKDGEEYFTLIDKSGNAIVEPTKGCAVESLGDGRFEVIIDGEISIYAADGGSGLPEFNEARYGKITSINPFGDGLAYITTQNGFRGFIDTEGNVVIGEDALKGK